MLFSALTFSSFENELDTVLCEWLSEVAQSQSPPIGRPNEPLMPVDARQNVELVFSATASGNE